MRIVSSSVLLSLLLPSLALANSWRDASGELFSAPTPKPTRIVALAPSLAEIAGGFVDRRVIAVADQSDYPAWLKGLPTVGPFHRVNVEKVVSLQPDLILATTDGNSPGQVSALRKNGLKVLVVRSSTVEEWLESMTWVARALGEDAKGAELVQRMRDEFTKLAVSGPKKNVLLVLDTQPWITIGPKTLLFDALTRIGLNPLIPGVPLSATYPKISLETIWAAPLDAVLVPGRSPESTIAERERSHFSKKGVRMLQVPSDELLRPTPRLIEGLKKTREAVLGQSRQ